MAIDKEHQSWLAADPANLSLPADGEP